MGSISRSASPTDDPTLELKCKPTPADFAAMEARRLSEFLLEHSGAHFPSMEDMEIFNKEHEHETADAQLKRLTQRHHEDLALLYDYEANAYHEDMLRRAYSYELICSHPEDLDDEAKIKEKQNLGQRMLNEIESLETIGASLGSLTSQADRLTHLSQLSKQTARSRRPPDPLGNDKLLPFPPADLLRLEHASITHHLLEQVAPERRRVHTEQRKRPLEEQRRPNDDHKRRASTNDFQRPVRRG